MLDMLLWKPSSLHVLFRHELIAYVHFGFINLLGDLLAAGDELVLREAGSNPKTYPKTYWNPFFNQGVKLTDMCFPVCQAQSGL